VRVAGNLGLRIGKPLARTDAAHSANVATSGHAQVCGTTADLSATTHLDVEITSRTHRQPSPSPLRVSGQLF
jgi:hypothetical protein